MCTALLLASSGNPKVTVTPSGTDWDHINSIRRPLRFVPSMTAFAEELYEPDASNHDVSADAMLAQFVSGIFPAQTIAGLPVALFVNGRETSAANNLFLAWTLYAIDVAGAGTLGTLVSHVRTSALELSAGAIEADRQARSDVRTATSFNSSGDPFRLVLEVGAGGTPSSGRHNFGMMFGDVFADGSMSLIHHGDSPAFGPTDLAMLLFSEELLPPVDDGIGGGGTYGFARML